MLLSVQSPFPFRNALKWNFLFATGGIISEMLADGKIQYYKAMCVY